MKILLCFGTRPEAIKMAPVIHELRDQGVDFTVCITAQHREMLDQVLAFFEIKPDFDLNIMQQAQGLNSLSSRILESMEEVLDKTNPDLMLVQGDTTTAFFAAMAAFNRQVPVGHIEAGLRTFNLKAPFPEEGNRQLISRIAAFHFVPTAEAKKNLVQESIPDNQIFQTGNTVVDALQFGKEKLLRGYTNEDINSLEKKIDPEKKMILVTGHRRENFGKGMENLCEAIKDIASKNLAQVIFPVHLNPKVKKTVEDKLKGIKDVFLVPPVNYPCMLWLLDRCDLIISDSGGIQEEAPSFKKPVLVTREVSERMEGVEAGFSFLVGTSKKEIFESTFSLLNGMPKYEGLDNPYGDGKAAQNIVSIIKTSLL